MTKPISREFPRRTIELGLDEVFILRVLVEADSARLEVERAAARNKTETTYCEVNLARNRRILDAFRA